MRLLVVEDDTAINAMICEYLSKQGYACYSAFSGSEAGLLLKQESYDLIILDLMLPGKSGDQVLYELKKKQDTPVIVLSAKDSVESKVALLQSGADDYMCKPFDLKELQARIQVQIRKCTPDVSAKKSYQGLILHHDYCTIQINENTQKLTKHEYKILELLISHPKQAFTKKEIYEYAWEDDYFGDDKTITVHISNLRSKLAILSEREYIETIWGIGFKMKG